MKRYSSAASLVLALLAVLGLAGPMAAGEQVPFRGRFAGVVTLSGGPEILTAAVNATGNATQLGQFTLAIPHLGPLPFPFHGPPPGSISSWRPTATRSPLALPGKSIRYPAASPLWQPRPSQAVRAGSLAPPGASLTSTLYW